ncbi:hypothetical protein ABIE26_002192 [Pedobacter africanus]|uniref:Uncharacterized protein n=1 Tax=Pedobacter africanus TaxID=151894 RepID=A0ACC6KYJ0_9SPHI|nr:hypothetical protein [Pedobacter africanus]
MLIEIKFCIAKISLYFTATWTPLNRHIIKPGMTWFKDYDQIYRKRIIRKIPSGHL